jgi:hypothetical protein
MIADNHLSDRAFRIYALLKNMAESFGFQSVFPKTITIAKQIGINTEKYDIAVEKGEKDIQDKEYELIRKKVSPALEELEKLGMITRKIKPGKIPVISINPYEPFEDNNFLKLQQAKPLKTLREVSLNVLRESNTTNQGRSGNSPSENCGRSIISIYSNENQEISGSEQAHQNEADVQPNMTDDQILEFYQNLKSYTGRECMRKAYSRSRPDISEYMIKIEETTQKTLDIQRDEDSKKLLVEFGNKK